MVYARLKPPGWKMATRVGSQGMLFFLGTASARTPACLGWQGSLWQMVFTGLSAPRGTVILGERSPDGCPHAHQGQSSQVRWPRQTCSLCVERGDGALLGYRVDFCIRRQLWYGGEEPHPCPGLTQRQNSEGDIRKFSLPRGKKTIVGAVTPKRQVLHPM